MAVALPHPRRPRRHTTLLPLAALLVLLTLHAPRPTHATRLSRTVVSQVGIHVPIHSVAVDVATHTSTSTLVDTDPLWSCVQQPVVHFIINAASVGAGDRHLSLTVNTQSPTLQIASSPLAWSQSFLHAPSPHATCATQTGTDIVYLGNGAFWHAATSWALRARTDDRAHGTRPVLGLLPQHPAPGSRPGGAWGGDKGWHNMTMFFGDATEPGWIYLNTTTPHPMSHNAHTDATPLMPATLRWLPASDGTAQDTLAVYDLGPTTLRVVPVPGYPDTAAWRLTTYLVPEYPFLDLPPLLYDIIVRHANAHDPDSIADNAMLHSLVLTIHGKDFPLARSDGRLVLKDTRTLSGRPSKMRFLTLRPWSHTDAIRIGCPILQASVFLANATATPGVVHLSLSPIPDVQRISSFNSVYAFTILGLTLLVWTVTTNQLDVVPTAHAHADTSAPLFAPLGHKGPPVPAHCVLVLNAERRRTLVEAVGIVASVATAVVNTQTMFLAERYAKMVGVPVGPGPNHYARFSFLIVLVCGAWVTLIALAEFCEVYYISSRIKVPLAPIGARIGRDIERTLTMQPLGFSLVTFGGARRTKGRLTTTSSANKVVVNTVLVWNLQVVLRRMLFEAMLLISITMTLCEGTAASHNPVLLMAIGLFIAAKQMSNLIFLTNATVSHLLEGGQWFNSFQIAIVLAVCTAIITFVVTYITLPLTQVVFEVFDSTSDVLLNVCFLFGAAATALGLFKTKQHGAGRTLPP